MQEWQTIIAALLPVFGIVMAGIIVRRLNWLTEQADRSLIQLCLRLFFPCLIIREMTRGDWYTGIGDLILVPAAGFALTGLGFLVAAIAVTLFGKQIGLTTPASRRTFILCAGIFNYGYIPIPLVRELFPGDTTTMSTLLLHNVGVETAMWTIGILILMGRLQKRWWAGILNPVVLSIIVAIVLKLIVAPLMIAHPLPHQWEVIAPFAKAVEYIGDCAIPMSLILTGATISDVWRDADLRDGVGTVFAACVVRLGLIPLLFLLIARTVPLEQSLTKVILIQAAMPSAIFPIVLARHYGGDAPTAVRVVLGTHFLCLATTTIWLTIGL